MDRIYQRSWFKRWALALSLGTGTTAAFVLPAFGQAHDLSRATGDGADQLAVDPATPVVITPSRIAGDIHRTTRTLRSNVLTVQKLFAVDP